MVDDDEAVALEDLDLVDLDDVVLDGIAAIFELLVFDADDNDDAELLRPPRLRDVSAISHLLPIDIALY